MTSGVINMENDGDWTKFQSLIEKAIDKAVLPIHNSIKEIKSDISVSRKEQQQSMKELPCGDHGIKLNTIETQLANGRQYKKEEATVKKDSKDFVIKAITIVISGMALIAAAAVGLHQMGIFKAMAK